MRFTGVLFFCLFWLSVATAADKDCLASGERVDEFLVKQIGGGFLELTTNSQEKKPLQRWLEEIVLEDGRKEAPGRWIDEVPCSTPKPLPDVAPVLSTVTLYSDAEAVKAHWDVFLKRYYLTGNYLKEHGGMPKPPDMPALAIAVPTLRDFVDKGDHWDWWRRSKYLSMPLHHNTEEYLSEMGTYLLYADFLYARGDAEAKSRAFNLLCELQTALMFSKYRVAVLPHYVFKEMLWPMVDFESGRWNNHLFYNLGIVFRDTKEEREIIRLQKWVIRHVPDVGGNKWGFLVSRSNQYVSLKDYTGAIFCTVASKPIEKFDEEVIRPIKIFLNRKYGAEKGAERYRQFLEFVAPVAQDPYAKEELAKLVNTKSGSASGPDTVGKIPENPVKK
jgi:hypothetical protein